MRVQLDGHVLRAGHLQDRRRAVTVEGDVGVGKIVDQDDLVLPCELDQACHPGQVHALGGGVVGEGQDHHPRLGPCRLPRFHQVVEELLRRVSLIRAGPVQADVADVGAGEQRGIDVDRVRGRRDEGGVPRSDQHPHEVGQPFLGPDGGDHLGVGIERHFELAEVEIGDGLADLGDSTAGRVPVVPRIVHGLGQLLHGHVGRRQVGVAEPEVDDVVAVVAGPAAFRSFDGGKDVRGKAVDPSEFHQQRLSPHPAPLARGERPRAAQVERARSAASATASSDSGQAHTTQVAPDRAI